MLIAQIFLNIINMLIFIVFCCLCLDVQIAERDRVQQCTNDDDADNDHLWTFMGDKICVWWWRQSLLPPANFFLNIDHKCSDEGVWDICTSPCICWWFLIYLYLLAGLQVRFVSKSIKQNFNLCENALLEVHSLEKKERFSW